MKLYARERCANPGAYYASAKEVLADADLTTGEKEYILKSMAVDAELLDVNEPANAAQGEYPAEVTEIHQALNQLGVNHSFDGKNSGPAGTWDGGRRPFKRIVAAVAGHDDLDREIVKFTESVSHLSGGEVAFVSVIPPDPGPTHYGAAAPLGGAIVAPLEAQADLKTRLDERKARVREILSEAADGASPYHLEVRQGRIDDEVLRAAKERSADLIVIGSHHRSWIAGLFSSENAQQVASLSTCPVLIVPETVKD